MHVLLAFRNALHNSLEADQNVVFTPWGIISGLFWVPGGVATIFAVKEAGLAVGIGVGSSFIVLVSFVWGIFIFNEPVHSKVWASCAVLLMIVGICGMSYFSSPEAISDGGHDPEGDRDSSVENDITDTVVERVVWAQPGGDENEDEHEGKAGLFLTDTQGTQSGVGMNGDSAKSNKSQAAVLGKRLSITTRIEYKQVETSEDTEESASSSDSEVGILAALPNSENDTDITHHLEVPPPSMRLLPFRLNCSRRTLGILAAVFNGTWGGSIMVPMHWAP